MSLERSGEERASRKSGCDKASADVFVPRRLVVV